MAKKALKQEPKKVGRPSDYTLEIATRICEEIATSTDSYEKMCDRNPDFPERATMRRWRYKNQEFRSMYDQAKADQADLLIDEIFDVADDGRNDWMFSEKANGYVVNGEAIARSRLRVDTRKWVACKLLYKKYGDKPEEPKGDINQSLETIAQAIADAKEKHAKDH